MLNKWKKQTNKQTSTKNNQKFKQETYICSKETSVRTSKRKGKERKGVEGVGRDRGEGKGGEGEGEEGKIKGLKTNRYNKKKI